jgi:thioredoxin-dependent peroxiredoxin
VQLGQLQGHLAEFTAMGVNVAAVSADDLEGARKMVANKDLRFPILSDPKGAMLRSYQHWDSESDLGLAGTFVIRPDRSIVFYEDDGEKFYRRPSAARVLEVARGL